MPKELIIDYQNESGLHFEVLPEGRMCRLIGVSPVAQRKLTASFGPRLRIIRAVYAAATDLECFIDVTECVERLVHRGDKEDHLILSGNYNVELGGDPFPGAHCFAVE